MYMAIVLALGLMIIQQYRPFTANFIIRKAFHLLAFVLFTPGIIHAKHDKPKLMVFAFNCVSVALIAIEVLRYSGKYFPQEFSAWFKKFSDGRERLPNTMILTHIYLLMGCALPFTSAFILSNGSVFTPRWVLWTLSGVVFLGIGDSSAALMGKWYGRTRWRENSNKTQEGSSYCVISISVVYWFLCNIVDLRSTYLFLCYVFAAIPTAVLEGCTLQYDNLICSMFFFSCVIFFNQALDM
uniref:dolichol kinase n=1 Tax=Strombidium rassoulzadegani TaxID=1082188 RepID=A0A7S3FVZ0_9SPIT|mmetsp:Transcript_3715/g.6338  ORF Transcript_3715/g.6338 Transcript_3715/m.6338 type:complete len:240 (+) Transcript_3715:787-1506(+)